MWHSAGIHGGLRKFCDMKRTAAILALMGCLALPALAQGQWGSSWSPTEARSARERGVIKPLKDIFRDLKRRFGGYQLNAELFSRETGGMEYHVAWMTEDGRKIDLVIDAATGQIVETRGA